MFRQEFVIRLASVFTFVALLAGCDSPIFESFEGLMAVQSAIAEHVGADTVSANITNGAWMTITIANSSLNDASKAIRQASADSVAKIVLKTYPDASSLERLGVTLVSVERKYLIVTYTQAIDSFVYFRNDLDELEKEVVHHDQ